MRPTAYNRDLESLLAEGADATLEPLDEARWADPVEVPPPPRGDEDDAEYYVARKWPLYLLADDRVAVLNLPPRLVARLRRVSDARLGTAVLRAIEELVTRREAELAAEVPGSAPPDVPLWQPPVVEDALPATEVRAAVAETLLKLRRGG